MYRRRWRSKRNAIFATRICARSHCLCLRGANRRGRALADLKKRRSGNSGALSGDSRATPKWNPGCLVSIPRKCRLNLQLNGIVIARKDEQKLTAIALAASALVRLALPLQPRRTDSTKGHTAVGADRSRRGTVSMRPDSSFSRHKEIARLVRTSNNLRSLEPYPSDLISTTSSRPTRGSSTRWRACSQLA